MTPKPRTKETGQMAHNEFLSRMKSACDGNNALPSTKRFLGRTLTWQHGRWVNATGPAFPFIAIGCIADTWRVVVLPASCAALQTEAPTERAARNAMVRKLRRLRDELSELEF